MPDFGLLGPLMVDLHQEFVRIYYLMLPVFFCLSIAVTWFRGPGGFDFLDVLKRAVISTLLLAAFPEITQAIVFIADGIAERVDQMQGLDMFLQLAKEKSLSFTFVKNTLLLQFPDLLIAVLAFVSYLVLYIARYLTVAMYHFYWVFYTVSCPLLLLFNLFPSTSRITANLFRGMVEVASWKIVWAILGAMLTALSVGTNYRSESDYLILMVMNFVIAISMLKTPSVVSSLVGSGFTSMAPTIGNAATMVMAAVPARAALAYGTGAMMAGRAKNFAASRIANHRAEQEKRRAMLRY
jgi:hypothetical protein